MELIETVRRLLKQCEECAKEKKEDLKGWIPNRFDLEWIEQKVGTTLTEEEWMEAFMPWSSQWKKSGEYGERKKIKVI